MKHITKKNLLLIFLTILCLICLFLLRFTGKQEAPFIQLGNFRIPSTARSGVISGSLSLLSFLLIFTDYKKGFRIGIVINCISVGNLLYGIIKAHSLVSLPGIVTSTLSFIILITFYSFYSRLAESNLTDFITGQGNRRKYVKELKEHIEAKRSFTLACVELDDFKHIIDLYGISAGDYLLNKAAEKLTSILDKKDILFRITGSTFAIIFEPGESPEERLKNVISAENIVIPADNAKNTEASCILSLSAGIVYSHPPYNFTRTASSILRDAETALATTRNMTEHKICIYNESMENAELKQREAEFLIKESLENNYFYLVYQPQFTMQEKKLRGFETLIRCRKPDGSTVNPSEFIPTAEKSNLIMKIDDYVLHSAMKEFKSVIENSNRELIISVNISAKNIGCRDFADRIKKIVEEVDFPPECLELEITEYSFAESRETTIANINTLKEMGIKIALDDFGTGYTSIAQLMKLPISLLKIDKSLIDDIETNESMRHMIDSVIYMGHIMNCQVISEGVENDKQLSLLKDNKCDFIQGFVWGRPLNFADAELLTQQHEEY
ncbi:MAG: bifunctional diguanylate cyclase/phosphodiesterase [Treponema sp.]|nr:bifunctional diguanylate cyclase/phosphodiesterase [Treponema sp.]